MNNEFNQKINCSVTDCRYNREGRLCQKNAVCICCSEEGCTLCGSYDGLEE